MTSRSYFLDPSGSSGEIDRSHAGEVRRSPPLSTEGLGNLGAADIRLDNRPRSSVVGTEGTHVGGQGGWLQEFEHALRDWNATFNPAMGELAC